MRRLPVFLFLLLLSGFTLSLTPQDAMMEALKTGNYSVVEPYLGDGMRGVFTERVFSAVRGELVDKFGQIRGYTLEKVVNKNNYRVYYYRVTAERGSYRVSVTVRNGRVEGFHLVPDFNPAGAIYPLTGGLLGLLLLWAYLRKFHAGELVLGTVLLIPVLLVQPPLQALPGYLGLSDPVYVTLWSGLVASLIQEPLKYYFARDKTLGRATYVGAGFGIGEALYVSTLSAIFGGSMLALVERALALMFHASTTLLFAHSHRSGAGRRALLIAILLHWLLDWMASYWHFTRSELLLWGSYLTMLGFSLAIFWKLLPLARTENEEPAVRW
ncbi:hypothetical protein [Thermococcus sp.]|uniref:hypothetical protein n=1 Tax=Thermococcus sp. TaxID=35749 RepID=UPI00261BB793|nr:hypothetical protein [Thermococcus sp.]